jgi:acyl-CoA synthetase (AMP-forming)/AMP-acid ligase II
VKVRGVVATGTRDEQSGTDAIILGVETPERDPARLRDLRRAIEDAVLHGVGLRPDSVLFVRPGSLPRTTSGKLKRSAAAQMIAANTLPGTGAQGTSTTGAGP